MASQFAVFRLPVTANSPEQDELNRFLRGRTVAQYRQEFVNAPSGAYWSFLVEYYYEKPNSSAGEREQGVKKDYKEILSPEDYKVFNRLRTVRKEVADAAAVPVYAVFSNEQLAAMVRAKPTTESELKQVDGIGDAKCAKYGASILAVFTETSSGTDRIPF